MSREHASEASGVFNSVGQLSASFGFATVGSTYFAIAAGAAGPSDGLYSDALSVALGVGIGAALLAAAVAVRLPQRHINSANQPTDVDVDR